MTWTLDAIEAGKAWEEEFAAKFGGRLQPGSGNTPYAKLDVGGKNILWWLRNTAKNEFTITHDILDEAITGARGLGGPGVIPGIGLKIGGRDVVVMEAADLLTVLSTPGDYAVPERKADTRRRHAAQTTLERR